MERKPGVMIYFDLQGVLDRLSDRHAGILFRAILQYGETRKIPDLPDPLYLLWPMIQLRLDSDDQRYYRVSQKRKYAVYTRWTKHHGQTPLSYEDWLAQLDRCEDQDVLLS